MYVCGRLKAVDVSLMLPSSRCMQVCIDKTQKLLNLDNTSADPTGRGHGFP